MDGVAERPSQIIRRASRERAHDGLLIHGLPGDEDHRDLPHVVALT